VFANRPGCRSVQRGPNRHQVGRRIDYVLIRSGVHGPSLDILDCRLILDSPVNGVWASDHYGVVADLAVPTHRPGAWI
jgi:endonuclease/exonuclease/phosphatase family metal-dependent hydrolase